MKSLSCLQLKQAVSRSFFLGSVILISYGCPAYGFQLDFSNIDQSPDINDNPTTNNLSNGNTDGIGATMIYESVAIDNVNGVTLNLIVTTIDSYSGDTTKNGNINTSSPSADGRINITSGTSTTFKFSLVNAADNSPYVANTLEFGMFDIDGNNNQAGTNPRQEKVTLYTSADYTVTDPNNFASIIDDGDRVEILAEDKPVSLPNDSSQLFSTVANPQEQHAVKFKFNNISDFELEYEVIGGNSTRNFYFAGDIFFDELTQTVTFERVPFEFSPSLGLLLSGGGLLGMRFLKRRANQS